jgi:hypothetical protein
MLRISSNRSRTASAAIGEIGTTVGAAASEADPGTLMCHNANDNLKGIRDRAREPV